MGTYERLEINGLQKVDFNNKLIEVLGYVQDARFHSRIANGYILGLNAGRIDFYSQCAEAIALIKDAYQKQQPVVLQGRGIGQKLQIEDVILQDEGKPSVTKKNGTSPIEKFEK